MTEGAVGPLLMHLTIPVAWGILALFAYRLAEAWFISRLGPQALAAAGFAFPITMVVLSVSIGLSAGTSSVIARALGNQEAGVPRLVADSLILTALVGAAFAVAGMATAGWLARLLGAGPDIVPLIALYLRVWFPSVVLILVAQVGLSAARAAGDATFQGTAMVASSLLNLAFAPFLILGVFNIPGLGLVGAPLASLAAWVPLLAATVWRLEQLDLLSFDQMRLDAFLVSTRRILRVGLPAAGTNAVIPFATGVITRLLSGYGPLVVAGFSLGGRVEAMAMVLFFALSAVMNPFAGQNSGPARITRVREAMRVTAWFCAGFGALLAAVLYVGRFWIARLFTHDTAVVASMTMYLALVPISYGPGGFIAIANAAFNGLNRPLAAVAISVARTLVVNVPVAWIGGRLFGAAGVLLGICVSNVLVGVGSFVWVYSATRYPRERDRVPAVVSARG